MRVEILDAAQDELDAARDYTLHMPAHALLLH